MIIKRNNPHSKKIKDITDIRYIENLVCASDDASCVPFYFKMLNIVRLYHFYIFISFISTFIGMKFIFLCIFNNMKSII